jgi:ribosomal 50S subunit-recycling heat shock protein
VLVDGSAAKPAHSVRVGEILSLDAERAGGEWEVLAVPRGNVPKADRPLYARRLR